MLLGRRAKLRRRSGGAALCGGLRSKVCLRRGAQGAQPQQLGGVVCHTTVSMEVMPGATSSVLASSSNGLQPNSDGLHPNSNGLQSRGDGLHPSSVFPKVNEAGSKFSQ